MGLHKGYMGLYKDKGKKMETTMQGFGVFGPGV